MQNRKAAECCHMEKERLFYRKRRPNSNRIVAWPEKKNKQ